MDYHDPWTANCQPLCLPIGKFTLFHCPLGIFQALIHPLYPIKLGSMALMANPELEMDTSWKFHLDLFQMILDFPNGRSTTWGVPVLGSIWTITGKAHHYTAAPQLCFLVFKPHLTVYTNIIYCMYIIYICIYINTSWGPLDS